MAVSTIDPNGLNVGQLGGTRNLIINGAMTLAQRGTSTTSVGDGTVGYLTVDRFRFQKAGSPTARYTMTQDSNAPDDFGSSLKLEVTTADTSVASTSLQYVDQFIEAQNLQQLAYGTSAAKTITLSFYVRCSTAQTFALDLVNEDNSRYFNTTYAVSSADTWERKTITIPADTTSGFNNDNGRGLRVRWTLVAGSDFTGGSVSTAWSGTQNTATNHENTWVGATGRTWQLTGVMLEVGDTATDFEHESYGTTLQKCLRYYEVVSQRDAYCTIAAYTTTAGYGAFYYMVGKRSTPTITFVGSAGDYRFRTAGGDRTLTLIQASSIEPTGFRLDAAWSTTTTAGNAGWVGHRINTTRIEIDAEL